MSSASALTAKRFRSVLLAVIFSAASAVTAPAAAEPADDPALGDLKLLFTAADRFKPGMAQRFNAIISDGKDANAVMDGFGFVGLLVELATVQAENRSYLDSAPLPALEVFLAEQARFLAAFEAADSSRCRAHVDGSRRALKRALKTGALALTPFKATAALIEAMHAGKTSPVPLPSVSESRETRALRLAAARMSEDDLEAIDRLGDSEGKMPYLGICSDIVAYLRLVRAINDEAVRRIFAHDYATAAASGR